MPLCLDKYGKKPYSPGMTTDEIKAAIKAQGYTIGSFAKKLGITGDALGRVLSGARPFSPSLRKHIELLLANPATPPTPQEAVFVYRVNLTAREVRELIGEKYLGGQGQDPDGMRDAKDTRPGEDGITITPEMEKALHLIITHNLRRLARIGAQWEGWNPEDRALLDVLENAPEDPPEA